jgi:hypothetical protein
MGRKRRESREDESPGIADLCTDLRIIFGVSGWFLNPMAVENGRAEVIGRRSGR